MKQNNEEIVELNKKILVLENLLSETKQNIIYLDIIVSEKVVARDNEIKKKEITRENIDKLKMTLKKLIISNKLE